MKVFTTTKVAEICEVSRSTVLKWFDSGRLKGYRFPGSHVRKIPREYLKRFLKENGMPLGALEDIRILIVSRDQAMIISIKKGISLFQTDSGLGFEIIAKDGACDACARVKIHSPLTDCLIVDFSIGEAESQCICQSIRQESQYPEIILFALLPEDFSENISTLWPLADRAYKKPINVNCLIEEITTRVEQKRGLS